MSDLFHPLDVLTVEIFLNGDMRPGRCRRSMPVLLTRRDPHDVAFPEFLGWTTPLLNPTGAGRHDERLTEGVGVPSRPRAGRERHAAARRA
jgi:hypothetical protein